MLDQTPTQSTVKAGVSADQFAKAAGTAGWLWLLPVASFITLVPGGPAETRDVSALGSPVFWGFDAFLILLGLVGYWRCDRFAQRQPGCCLGGDCRLRGLIGILDLTLALYVGLAQPRGAEASVSDRRAQ